MVCVLDDKVEIRLGRLGRIGRRLDGTGVPRALYFCIFFPNKKKNLEILQMFLQIYL